jgi:hypothetical protein
LGGAVLIEIRTFQDMRSHYIAARVVEHKVDKLKLHHAMESRPELVKKLLKIAMRRNCLRDLEQRLMLALEQTDVSSR